jgi:P4 family phage/plasmid primase-like protien
MSTESSAWFEASRRAFAELATENALPKHVDVAGTTSANEANGHAAQVPDADLLVAPHLSTRSEGGAPLAQPTSGAASEVDTYDAEERDAIEGGATGGTATQIDSGTEMSMPLLPYGWDAVDPPSVERAAADERRVARAELEQYYAPRIAAVRAAEQKQLERAQAEHFVPVIRSHEICGFPDHGEGGQAKYMPLDDALTKRFPFDAHFMQYCNPQVARRINLKVFDDHPSLAMIGGALVMTIVVVDVDCELSHKATGGTALAPAPDDWWCDEVAKVATLRREHPGVYVYRTRGGYRLVASLPAAALLRTKADADTWSRQYLELLAYLTVRFDIRGDPRCADCGHLFRLPHATRDRAHAPEEREAIGDPRSVGSINFAVTSEISALADTLSAKSRTDASNANPKKKGPSRQSAIAVDGEGVLFHAFKARGDLGPQLSSGKWAVRCPWYALHTLHEALDSSTVLYAPGEGDTLGWLHCSHAHCATRTIRDVLNHFTQDEVNAARRATTDFYAGCVARVEEIPSNATNVEVEASLVALAPKAIRLTAVQCVDIVATAKKRFPDLPRKEAEASFKEAIRRARSASATQRGNRDENDHSGGPYSAGGDASAIPPAAAQGPGGQGRVTDRCTELHNAERLLELHGSSLRYVGSWKRWLVWDGGRWREDDIGAALRFATDCARLLVAEAIEELDRARERAEARDEGGDADVVRAEEVLKWCIDSENHRAMVATLAIAGSFESVAVSHTALDADPMLLNVANGTLDLRTGTLRAARREDLLTRIVPVDYDPAAICPIWDRYLLRAMGGDPEMVAYLQRILGYSLSGSIAEHMVVFFYGGGANGKTTFLATVHHLLGDYAGRAPRGLLFRSRGERHPTELATLFGKRFVSCSEIEAGQAFDEALLKDLSGGDRISTRRMREDFWEFDPTHKLFLAGNHKPVVHGEDDGIWRRLRLVPWMVAIPEAEQDKALPEKLRAELPGILRWAVAGCAAWQRIGLGTPPTVLDATARYRKDSDHVGQFIDAMLRFEPEGRITRVALRESYEQWCEEVGHQALGPRRLAERVRLAGAVEGSVRTIAGPRDGWHGVRLIAPEEHALRAPVPAQDEETHWH